MNRATHCMWVWMVMVGVAGVAQAATHNVDVGPGFVFTPDALTVDEGDTVKWTWAGGFHDVESGVGGAYDGNFDSGSPTSVGGTTFEVTFDAAFLSANAMPGNVYPYYCSVHFGSGMDGTITVTPNPVPTVSEWGMIVMGLLLVTAGTILVRRRRMSAVPA
ncbi:MAG: IPTL-CTERM sorting domain-containing protein [bacterium]|nr:IPTL-CTERM sorting domain-containing protein [bacterium]